MAYQLTYEDVASKQPAAQAGKPYELTYEDVAPKKQTFGQSMGFDPDIPNAAQRMKELFTPRREEQLGLLQGGLNSAIGMANLLPNVNIPKANFAPNTENSHQAQTMANVMSYLGPRGVAKMLMGAKNVGKLGQYFAENPFKGLIAGNAGAGAEAGLFSAAHAPEGQKGSEALGGAVTGSGVDLLGRMTRIPFLGQAARAGLGYMIGNQVGHPGYGAAIGVAAPNALRSIFPASKNAIMEEIIGGIDPKDAARVGRAAERQGIRISPSEATGNPIQSLIEAEPRKSLPGMQEHLKQQVGRENEQQNMFKNFLNRIYEPTAVNEANINALYTKAYQGNLSMNTVNALKQDPIMMDAFNSVKRNPAFTDVPENNYQFLHQVDRTLGRQYRGKVKTDTNTAYEINQTKKNFNTLLKKENTAYEEAQKTSAPKYQREEIEHKINEDIEGGKVTGIDVYNKVLRNYNGYKDLVRSLKNNTEARQSLQDMRVIFKNLSKLPKPNSLGEKQVSGGSMQWWNNAMNWLKSAAGAKTDVAKIKYINGGTFMKDFDKLQQIKDARKYNKELLNLLGSVGVAYGLSPDSAENFKKAISE
jgi:hypothetical protein